MLSRRLAGPSLALAAGALVACGGRALTNPLGKMPITTTSPAALEEYLTGRDLVEKLRGAEARAHFQRAVDLDPKFALAYVGLVNTSSGPTELFPALRQAMELVERVSDAEANMIRAIDAGVNRRPDEQLRLFEANAKAYPDDERAHNMLGNYYFGAQNWEAAIAEYRRAIAISPSFSPPYNQLGYALRFLNQDEEAEATFKKYTELIPDEPNPYDSYAEMLLHLGRFRDSINEYKRALDLNPNFPSAYVGIGHALIYLGQPDEARKAFIKLRFIARNVGERRQAALWLAASYLFAGDHDGAIREIGKRLADAREAGDTASVSGDTEFTAELLLDAGRADDAQARFDEALRLLEDADLPEAIKETGRVDYLFDTARVKLARGDLAGAKAEADRYVQQATERGLPDELQLSHALLGVIAYAEHDYTRAIAEISQANMNDPRALLALARAQAAAGNTEEAMTTCRAALTFSRPDISNAFVYRPATELLAVLTAKLPPTPTS